MRDAPQCLVCGATYDVEFPMLGIKTSGFKFGDICVTCDVGDDGNCGCSTDMNDPEACRTHQVQISRRLRKERTRR